MIKWLENWYAVQCDGDWEHYFGIKIKTLDNPGWDVTIDLEDTVYELDDVPWTEVRWNDDDWFGSKIVNNQFNGAGDPRKLEIIFHKFKTLLESAQ